MSEYNHPKQSDTSSNNADKNYNADTSSSEPKPQSVNLEKHTTPKTSPNHQQPQNNQNEIDGFPLGGTETYQNGDYITSGYDNNYNNSNYVSQNSLSGKDENARTLAIVSLICGIISILLGCCCSCFNSPIAIAGIITGFMSNYDNGQKDNMAIAGIICSIISLFIAIGVLLITIFVAGKQ